MKKLLCIALCVPLLLAVLGLSACAGEGERTRYEMQLSYDPAQRTLAGEVRVDVLNTSENARSVLGFHLWGNAYREGNSPLSDLFAPAAYYAGESHGGVTIASVTGGEYKLTRQEGTYLEVALPSPLYPDERTTVTFSFTLALAAVHHRLGVGERAVMLTHFYPVLCDCGGEHVYAPVGDPFVAESADYAVSLTLPAGYTVAHTGRGEGQVRGEEAIWTMSAENVRDFAIVASEQFSVLSSYVDGVAVQYYFLEDPSPERTLSVACESLAFFSSAFGKYPYPVYAVVETDFPFGGMEYAGLSVLATGLGEDVPLVVAHETAHQWWYGMVGSDQYGEAWQDEGLAQFSAALFLGEHPQYGVSYSDCVSLAERGYRAYFSTQHQLAGEAGMRRPLPDFPSDYAYRSVVYDKGLILFDRLYSLLGEGRTRSALRRYVGEWTGKIAPAEALIACFSRERGYAEGIFTAFLAGTCVI